MVEELALGDAETVVVDKKCLGRGESVRIATSMGGVAITHCCSSRPY